MTISHTNHIPGVATKNDQIGCGRGVKAVGTGQTRLYPGGTAGSFAVTGECRCRSMRPLACWRYSNDHRRDRPVPHTASRVASDVQSSLKTSPTYSYECLLRNHSSSSAPTSSPPSERFGITDVVDMGYPAEESNSRLVAYERETASRCVAGTRAIDCQSASVLDQFLNSHGMPVAYGCFVVIIAAVGCTTVQETTFVYTQTPTFAKSFSEFEVWVSPGLMVVVAVVSIVVVVVVALPVVLVAGVSSSGPRDSWRGVTRTLSRGQCTLSSFFVAVDIAMST